MPWNISDGRLRIVVQATVPKRWFRVPPATLGRRRSRRLAGLNRSTRHAHGEVAGPELDPNQHIRFQLTCCTSLTPPTSSENFRRAPNHRPSAARPAASGLTFGRRVRRSFKTLAVHGASFRLHDRDISTAMVSHSLLLQANISPNTRM